MLPPFYFGNGTERDWELPDYNMRAPQGYKGSAQPAPGSERLQLALEVFQGGNEEKSEVSIVVLPTLALEQCDHPMGPLTGINYCIGVGLNHSHS